MEPIDQIAKLMADNGISLVAIGSGGTRVSEVSGRGNRPFANAVVAVEAGLASIRENGRRLYPVLD